MVEDVRNLVGRGLISRDAYASFIKKFNPQFGAAPAQAAPAESKAGKKTSAPLDVRPPAARNKPKPKYAKRAGHNPPKPEFAMTPSTPIIDQLKQREREIETRREDQSLRTGQGERLRARTKPQST
jgi:hypothetical protein